MGTMEMTGTIKPYNVDDMRIKASERIHAMFKGAPVIVVKYKDTFAKGYCQYKDGVMAFFTVWYRDLLIKPDCVQVEGQHERVMAYINSLAI